jgi:hypothetical protein
MNNKVENLDLKDKWVEIAQNCRFEPVVGAVDKRDPVTYLNTTALGTLPVVGLYRYYTSTGIAAWVAVEGTKASYVTDAGVATSIRTGLTTGKRTSFVTYRDLLIASNGYDNPWVWDGATTAVTVNESTTTFLLHMDGANASTTFTDSASGGKSVTAAGNAQISTAQSKFGGASALFKGEGIDTNTNLMLHMDGTDSSTTFTDSETTPKTVTANGNAQISTAQSKFGGASGLFDGTGDYLSTPDSADWDFPGDFTVDLWVRPGTLAVSNYTLVSNVNWGTSTGGWLLDYNATVLAFHFVGTGSYALEISGTHNFVVGTWAHVAVVRSGTAVNLYIDGVSVASGASSASSTSGELLNIGSNPAGTAYGFNGYIDELRISKGIARWTANFTPPTGAYSTGGDYLSVPDSDDWDFPGDFTIDVRLRPTSLNVTNYTIASNTNSSATRTGWLLDFNATQIGFHAMGSGGSWSLDMTGNHGMAINNWYHIAVVRSGTSLKLYVNGTSVASITNSGSITSTLGLYIGKGAEGSTYSLYGYLDEFRVTKGLARWTSDFVPSTTAYSIVSSVSNVGYTWELGACKAVASTASGSMDVSANYIYAVTIGSADQYTCGAVSNTAVSGTAGAMNLSYIPLGPVGTTARKVYRTVGGGTALLLLATISDNTTSTYADTITDGSLTTAYPAVTDDIPKGNLLTVHRERLFLSGDPTYPNKIYYSNPYLPHYMQVTTSTDYMEISPEDGDQIMGIPIQLQRMVCIKKNSIRKLYITSPVSGADPNTWYADDPIAWVGSPATWSITQTPSGVVFLGWDHWYIFDGAGAQPIFDEFNIDDILQANFSDVVGFFHNGIFLAAYTDKRYASQVNDRVMMYNLKREALSYDLWTGPNINGANCFASRSGDDEVGDLYYGDSAKGYIVKDKDTESTHRLKTKTEVSAGTKTNTFIGGTENSPTIEIGAITSASSIPNDICIFWDKELTTPGSGWTEITGYESRLLKISSTVTALTTAAGSSHTHTLTGSIPMWFGSTINAGDGNPSIVAAHTHEVSAASDATTPFPRNVKYRVFKKNLTTTEYEFPDGAIVPWSEATAPDGWQLLSSEIGYYVSQSTTGLAVLNPATHSHTFNIPTGTAAGNLGQSEGPGANLLDGDLPRFGHNHLVTGALSTTTMDTWEVDYVALPLIKKIGETAAWDGVAKYAYALYASSGTPGNDWAEVSTYDGKFLKIGGSIATGSAANASHTHIAGTFTTSTENSRAGGGGYLATGYAAPHTHVVTLSASTTSAGTPASVSFRLFKKVLGKMKDYNAAIGTVYTAGTWTSPASEIRAESLYKMYWNQSAPTNTTVALYTRTGTTQALCEAASWSAALTNPNGSDIVSTATTWIQYKIELTSTDSTATTPKVYFTDGYVVKFNYQGGFSNAETSVNFEYHVGFRNFSDSSGLSINKIFKKVATNHLGAQGSFEITWETENASGTFTVPLGTYPERWDSYFPSDAYGKQLDIKIVKNDLFAFRISEVEGLYTPTDVII